MIGNYLPQVSLQGINLHCILKNKTINLAWPRQLLYQEDHSC